MDPAILSNNGIGVRMSVTDVSSRSAVVGQGDSLILTNPGSYTIYVTIGGSTISATTAGYPILAGTKEDEIVLDPTASYYATPYVAAVCESGQTGSLLVHRVSR